MMPGKQSQTRRLLFTAGILLLGCNASFAQVSTLGTTAMGIPTTPGTILISPLNGPGPFSAVTQPGTPGTTLAPVPLASNPATPGTFVTCATPIGQIAPGTAAVPVTSMSAISRHDRTAAIGFRASTVSAAAADPSASTTANGMAPFLSLSAQPATSFMTDIPGSTVPASPPPTVPALPQPSIVAPPVPMLSRASGRVSTSMARGMNAMMPSAATTSTALGTIPTFLVASTTGTISPVPPVGSSSTTLCSSLPGGPPTNSAALTLSTPDIPAGPPPGTIQPDVTPACHHQPRSDNDGGADAKYVGLRREHDDVSDDTRHDGPGQCHGCRRNAGRIVSVATRLLRAQFLLRGVRQAAPNSKTLFNGAWIDKA